jgi:hypothetical protein
MKKNTALFVVCGLVAAMFFFSLGILTSRPAQAQPIYSKLTGFPRQSELWSVKTTTVETFPVSPGNGNTRSGFRFDVTSTDPLHRLPVLTQWVLETSDKTYIILWREESDGLFAPFITVKSNLVLNAGSFYFHVGEKTFSPGITLQPGHYAIESQDNWGVMLSGYWALP